MRDECHQLVFCYNERTKKNDQFNSSRSYQARDNLLLFPSRHPLAVATSASSDISIASISIACEKIQSAARSTLLFVSFSAFVACAVVNPIATIISKPDGSGVKLCGFVSVPTIHFLCKDSET